MSEPAHLVTAEELARFPDDDYRYELVEGRVIRMSPVGFPHSKTVSNLLFLINLHLRARRLGVAVTELGFKLRSNPDTVRAPDVAFIRQDRIPVPDPRGFWQGTPDLAIEVLSDEDRPSVMRKKVAEYLRYGVPQVVVVDPDLGAATTYRPGVSPTIQGEEDHLDLSDLIEGFRCPVREIFS